MFDIPKVCKSDNGPPFNGSEFKEYALRMGFAHRKITPLWPEANGEVERFMRTLKKFLQTAGNWKEELHAFLRNYRSTPHCTTGVCPAEVLFKRPHHAKFPYINLKATEIPTVTDQMIRTTDSVNKQKQKEYADVRRKVTDIKIDIGDTVLVKQPKKNKFSTVFSPVPLTVLTRNHSMITAGNSERKITRNSSFFKKLHPETVTPTMEEVKEDGYSDKPEVISDTGDDMGGSNLEISSHKTLQQCELRISGRATKPPECLIEVK